jgi:hypothetical protein
MSFVQQHHSLKGHRGLPEAALCTRRAVNSAVIEELKVRSRTHCERTISNGLALANHLYNIHKLIEQRAILPQ